MWLYQNKDMLYGNGILAFSKQKQFKHVPHFETTSLYLCMVLFSNEWIIGKQCFKMVKAIDEQMEEYLKYCKYFKGEDECPEQWKGTTQGNFWHGESMFVRGGHQVDDLKKYVEDVLKNLKGEKRKKFLSYTEEQRAIVIYIELLFGKWCPYDDLSWIFEY